MGLDFYFLSIYNVDVENCVEVNQKSKASVIYIYIDELKKKNFHNLYLFIYFIKA